MANRPFLMAHGSPVPLTAAEHEEAILAAASNQIPLLWLSLFSEADLKMVDMALEDAEGNESRGPVPTLHAATPDAVVRYQGRSARLQAALPAALLIHMKEWELLLSSVTTSFVQIDLAEIWMMDTPEESERAFRSHVRAFEEGGEAWAEACGQACLDVLPGHAISFDPAVVRYGLRGYQWDRPVPWED